MNNFFTGSFSVNEGKINRKRKRSLNNWDKEQLAKGGGSNVPNMNSSFNKANTMQTNKEIFDTLSDVSTDDSDIQITCITTSNTPQKNNASFSNQETDSQSIVILDNNDDTEMMNDRHIGLIDYLTCPPDFHITPKIDYLNINYTDIDCPSSTSSSSDCSDSDSPLTIVHVDNDLSFVIDGENVANINVTETKTNEAEDNNQPNKTTDKKKKKKKSKSQKRFPNNPELRNDSRMFKYWSQRYNLFERFDMGIKLDKESWYSVTAEYIAKQQAELCKETDTVLDGFCGAGGNSIQFCFKCSKVIAVDIDPVKIELTKNNCHVYGVDMDKITIMKEDFYSFANQYTTGDSVIQVPQIDVVFLSPPWGGQNYLMNQKNQSSSPDGIDLDKLISTARLFKPKSIMIYLPRNTDDSKLRQFVQPNESVEIIKHDSRYKKHIDKKIKAITAVFRL